jgi:predicted dehydrogenase/nucleoside-diphosphate-sugar epimerase
MSDQTEVKPFIQTIIVGAGKMARHHADALMRCPTTMLAAIVDPDLSARRAIGDRFRRTGLFSSLDEALEAGVSGARAVHVCTPWQTHHDLALRAIEAGCHVYVEKPFAPSVGEAERMLDEAAERGVHVCSGHQLLFEPPARRIRELFPALGSIAHVESYFAFRPVRRDSSGRRAMAADQQLFDVLPHPTYLLLDALEAAAPHAPLEVAGVTVGSEGTVHALLRRGQVTGVLVVTLSGRPVESYLRVVGTQGTVNGDFIRGTTQFQPGPGTSGISKLAAPYRASGQLAVGTSVALARRATNRQRSYPGLVELFSAFYASIQRGGDPALPPAHILNTVRVCEAIQHAVKGHHFTADQVEQKRQSGQTAVLVTGGTGLLGRAVVRKLAEAKAHPVSFSRREPAPWDREDGVEYRTGDLSGEFDSSLLEGIDTVIHCAAETSGGWEDHQANSIDASEKLIRAAASAGVKQFVQVSSIAVLAAPENGRPLDEQSPLEPDPRKLGPYGWGKAESEKRAAELGKQLSIDVKIVRPGPIVDFERFDPPGRLGRRVGPLFVAVGAPDEVVPLVDLRFAAEALAWIAANFKETPDMLNLLSPDLPTRRELTRRLKDSLAGVKAAWLPRALLNPLSWSATGAQRLLKPKRQPTDIAKAFSSPAYDTGLARDIAKRIGYKGRAENAGATEEDRPAA